MPFTGTLKLHYAEYSIHLIAKFQEILMHKNFNTIHETNYTLLHTSRKQEKFYSITTKIIFKYAVLMDQTSTSTDWPQVLNYMKFKYL